MALFQSRTWLGTANVDSAAWRFAYNSIAPGRAARVATPTFIPSEAIATYFEQRGYQLIASPTLYSGQVIDAAVQAADDNNRPVGCNLYIKVYGEQDEKFIVRGPQIAMKPGAEQTLTWQIPDTDSAPISEVGIEITSASRADGTIYLDYLAWRGEPTVTFRRPQRRGLMWKRAWSTRSTTRIGMNSATGIPNPSV